MCQCSVLYKLYSEQGQRREKKERKARGGGFIHHTLFRYRKPYLYYIPPSPSHLPCAFFEQFKTPKNFYRAHLTRPEEEEHPASLGVMLGECSGNKNVYERGLTL